MIAKRRRSVLAAGTVAAVALVAYLLIGTAAPGGAAVDTNAPVLASLAISPAMVDTSAGPAVVTITAGLTDETSPSIGGSVPLSRVILTGPGGQQQATAYLSQAQRISGSATDGIYQSTLTIPWHAEPGQWSAAAVLVDISGNTRTLNAADLGAAGFPTGVDQTGAGDTTAPQLVALGVAPSSVDTSLQPATITVTAHVVDDLSGVSDGVTMAASQVVLRGPTGAHHARATLSVDHRTSGDALDATFVIPITLPRWSEQGVWTVESVTLVDQVGNQRSLTAPGVTFTQTGIGDTSPPQFRSFSLSTTNVDVRTSSASIVVHCRIVDDLSGAADGIVDSPTTVVFASPSGRQRLIVRFGAAQLVGGDALDGNYSASATVAAHAEPGLWTMTDAWPADQAGNVGHLAASDWAAKGFTGSFTVVSDTPPDTGPTVPPTPTTTSVPVPTSLFTTTTGDPSATSTTFDLSTTTVDPSATSTTIGESTTTLDPSVTSTTDDSSSTTLDPSATSTTLDLSATSTTLDLSATSTTLDPSVTSTSVDESTTTIDPSATTTTTGATTTTTPETTTTTAPETTTTTTAPGTTTTGTTTTTTVPVHEGSHGRPRVRAANGYWFATSTGRVAGFGGAAATSVATATAGAGDPVVGIAGTSSGRGFWLTTAEGDVRPYGDARSYGSMRGHGLTRPIVGIAATPDGRGYWLVATDGGIFGFGDARFYGSTGAIRLNQPIVGMTVTPSGRGYWFVAADGGLFSYGDARFYGSMGAVHLHQPVVGMSASPTGHGYWMVARDGGIFSFGDARFFGSTGAMHLRGAIVGMASSPTAHGYWFVAADGGVFAFGDARFFGSMAGSPAPVVGMAVRAT